MYRNRMDLFEWYATRKGERQGFNYDWRQSRGPPRVEIVPLYSVSALFRILSLVHKYTVLGVTQTQPWIDVYERTVDF